MTPYHVKFAPVAYRQLQDLPGKQQKLLVRFAETLTVNPRPVGSKKIEGINGLYKEAVGPLRLIYKVEDQEVFILTIK